MGKNPIPPRSTVNRQVTAPFDERGGLLGFRTSAPRIENQTQQSVAQSETKMWSQTGLLTPELCVMYVYISLQLWDTREMNPCSLQLRLARVNQGESLRCNTQLLRSLHNQPPGEATVEQRAAGGRKREDELLNTCFLKYSGSHMPEWATTDTDKELWLWLWWLIYSIRGK